MKIFGKHDENTLNQFARRCESRAPRRTHGRANTRMQVANGSRAKSSTSSPNQLGFVGGSMGDDAVIVRGSASDTDQQKAALYSTVHGAGRVMSRTQAAGHRYRKGKGGSRGAISQEMMNAWVQRLSSLARGARGAGRFDQGWYSNS